MIEVGVKQLKNDLSAYLRQVARGERIRVTSRGRAVADILPAGQRRGSERIEQLIAEGRVTPGRSSRPPKAPPLAPPGPAASPLILAEREEDR